MQEIVFDNLTKKQKRRLLGLYNAFSREYGCEHDHSNKPKISRISFVVYFQKNKPIAFSSFIIFGSTYIRKEYTFVDKKYRGHGIGKELIKYFVEKYPEYEIETIAKEQLSNLLESLDFKIVKSAIVKKGCKKYVRNNKYPI